MRIHLVPFALLTVGVACVSYPNWLHKKLRFDENDQRVRMTIQTTTVVRAALTNERPLSTMTRTPLRVLGAVNSRHTLLLPVMRSVVVVECVFNERAGKPRRFNAGGKRFQKRWHSRKVQPMSFSSTRRRAQWTSSSSRLRIQKS